MTPQEAIKNIDDILDSPYLCDESIDYQLTTDDIECLEMAKEALEKQTPKKPIKYDDCEQFFIKCPCCQKRFDSRLGYKGCPYCLQAIRLE